MKLVLFSSESYRCPSHELQESGQTPVCLLSMRKACCNINNEMIAQLTSEVHELLGIDEVDETSGTLKWNKKAAELLEKLNRDCNTIAGQAFSGCWRTTGLVNGAIGTVLSISENRIMVRFDHIREPYYVEMVRSRLVYGHEKLLCVQKTVSTNPSLCCDHPR